MGANAPNSIIVTNLFNGSTGVSSTFVYSTVNSVPSITAITSAITNAAANSSFASALGGFVAGSFLVTTASATTLSSKISKLALNKFLIYNFNI